MATKKKKISNAALATKSLGNIGDIKTDRPSSGFSSMLGESARNGRAPVSTQTMAAPVMVPSYGTAAPVNTGSLGGYPVDTSEPTYTPVVGNRAMYAPTKTPAQRAADLMNAKYGSKIAALNSQGQRLDTDLTVGQATQTNYGISGDKKLEAIYADLTGQTQKIADNIKGVYAGADTAIAQGYTDSAAALSGVQGQATKMLSDQAAQLGLNQAIPSAAEGLNSYVGQAQAQGAIDRANSGANIKTLGANMSAAALKDVANTAQYGADNRRDLVLNVQNTISKLQFEHDKNKKDLLDQLSALQSEKADAIASATSEEEAKDYDRQYTAEQDRIQTDFANVTMKNNLEQQKFKNKMDKFDQEDRHNAQLNDTRLANQAAEIQMLQLREQIKNGTFNRTLAEKEFGVKLVDQALSQSKFTEEVSNNKRQNDFNEWAQREQLTQKWTNMSNEEKQLAISNFNDTVKLQQGNRALTLQESNQFIDNFNASNQTAIARQNAETAAAKQKWDTDPTNPDNIYKTQHVATSKAQEENYKALAKKNETKIDAYKSDIDNFYKANKNLGPEFKKQVDSIVSWSLRIQAQSDGDYSAKSASYTILYNNGSLPPSYTVGKSGYAKATPDELSILSTLNKQDKDKLFQAIKMKLG